MFFQSCRPASGLPDNKMAITEQSPEGVVFALQSRLTSTRMSAEKPAGVLKKNHCLKRNLDWLTT